MVVKRLSIGIIPAPRRGRNKTTIGRETPTPATFVGGKLPALLSAEFFQCDALELAPKLLGKLLRRDDVVLQITEVGCFWAKKEQNYLLIFWIFTRVPHGFQKLPEYPYVVVCYREVVF